MKRIILSVSAVLLFSIIRSQNVDGILQQTRNLLHEFDEDLPIDSAKVIDTVPNLIPMLLPAGLFIPDDRLLGITPWNGAPIVRPVVHVTRVDGLSGLVAAGEFSQDHPDRFFSTFNGNNIIDIPELFLTRQKFVGNTLRLGKKVYLVNGIMYGAQLGVRGNNWGMGTREGLVYRPSESVSVTFWTQYFQSVAVYSPVLFPRADGNMAAIRMPATPEVYSVGVQASFVAGEFIIGVGLSIAPVPFQDRQHSEFRYR